MKLRDRAALVTGAAAGIGRGLARRFAAEGEEPSLRLGAGCKPNPGCASRLDRALSGAPRGRDSCLHGLSIDYNMAKEALRTLTRTAAREWAPLGICCNVICPGAETEAFRRFAAAQPANAAAIRERIPMRRLGDPEADIGAVAVFLASDDCRYLTGNTLFVDGGSHINGLPWSPAPPDEAAHRP